MIKKYRLIIQDTFNKLELNKIYKIKNDRFIVNDRENVILYSITQYQLKNMFQEVDPHA